MLLIDVHAHLHFKDFAEDREETITQAKDAGVKVIIDNGTTPEGNREVLALTKISPLIKPAYGYYPVYVARDGVEKVKEEIAWIKEQKPIAIGEVGLDYKVGDDNEHGDLHKDVQQEGFRLLIRLANELDIPLIIHSRKAEEDVITILEEEKAKKVVMHCFMGKKKHIIRARDLGYSFSVPVSLLKLDQLAWLVQNVPLKQLLTETDSPYQGPIRGERNAPHNIALTVEKMGELLGMDKEEVSNQIFMNYQRLFL